MPEARAFSPAGISSFFEIKDRRPDGRAFENPARAGARGGGLVISRGIITDLRLTPARRSKIAVRINGRLARNAKTTAMTISRLLALSREKFLVAVDHDVRVPIGAGYGASAAGALSAALAFAEAAGLELSANQLGTVAHLAEIANGTGLGTVGPILTGGFVITRKAGAPGIAVIDRLPVSPRLKVVSACFGSISTKALLRSKRARERVNALGKSALRRITRNPTPRNFMEASEEFAVALGLMDRRTAQLLGLMKDAGAIGAAQNMVGQAVHAIAEEDVAQHIVNLVKERFSGLATFSCDIDFAGARLI